MAADSCLELCRVSILGRLLPLPFLPLRQFLLLVERLETIFIITVCVCVCVCPVFSWESCKQGGRVSAGRWGRKEEGKREGGREGGGGEKRPG